MIKKAVFLICLLFTFIRCNEMPTQNVEQEDVSTINIDDYERVGQLHNQALDALYSRPDFGRMDENSQFNFIKNYLENETGENIDVSLDEVNSFVEEYYDLDYMGVVEKMNQEGLISDNQKLVMEELENVMLITDPNMFNYQIQNYIESLKTDDRLTEAEKEPVLMFAVIAKHSGQFWDGAADKYFVSNGRNHTPCHTCFQQNWRRMLRWDGIGGAYVFLGCLFSTGFQVGPCLLVGLGGAVATSAGVFLIECGGACL